MNFALKYRPSNFSALLGQEVLVRIIRNSFSSGGISSPVLFVGASGIGKTTCARLLALCMNCKEGPTEDPCGQCESCVSIKNASSPDVIEIDAASNTGVDDIRVILENANYLPISSRFKVYIIDEVHMLSISAFNALLKTLESPAEHVRFIMATTEVRKVPITVVSRCQRLDLFKLTVDMLCSHLVKIAAAEGISCDDGSIRMIAENSGGSVRNALFLLEQASIYANGNITHADVCVLLGHVDRKRLEEVLVCIVNCEPLSAIEKFRVICETSNPVAICEGLLSLVYDISIYAYSGECKDRISEEILALPQAKSVSFQSRLWQMLYNGLNEVKSAEMQEQVCEMLILRLCYISNLPSPKKIADAIFSVENASDPVESKKKISDQVLRNYTASYWDAGRTNGPVEGGRSTFVDAQVGKENRVLGVKKNDANDQLRMYNPEDDEAVSGLMNSFKGASVVDLMSLDVK